MLKNLQWCVGTEGLSVQAVLACAATPTIAQLRAHALHITNNTVTDRHVSGDHQALPSTLERHEDEPKARDPGRPG